MRPVVRVMLFALIGLFVPGSYALAMSVSDLKCEYRYSPLDIESQHPRLSWILRSRVRGDYAKAYHIIVSSRRDLLDRNQGDLWDARPRLADSAGLPYTGKALTSHQLCYWKVRAEDAQGQQGPWSQTAQWEMGLLTRADWNAQWIDDGRKNPVEEADFYKIDPAPLFRKEFSAPNTVVSARLAISALGYYEARINGNRVGDAVLAPAWTNYAKRASYTIYDVTKLLHEGGNCIGVTLGNGWFNPLPLRMWGTYNLRNSLPVGRPQFIARLDVTFTNGNKKFVTTDPTWRVNDGPLQFNSIYLGEIYDARKQIPGWDRPGLNERDWHPAHIASGPQGIIEAQYQPPIRVTRILPTKGVTQPKPGVFIFDMGQNFAGLVRLKLSAKAGTKIVLRYGELLYKDGALNPMTSVAGQVKGNRRLPDGTSESIGGPGAPPIAWQTDTYIARGRGTETYTPQFTFHGFRYVEMSGYPGAPPLDTLVGLRMNSDVERTGTLVCSDSTLNQIQQMCDNTFLSNLFSVQSDCPHRERFGYGGDLVATCDAFMMNYNMERFYAKAVRDWADAALPDGMLTDTAPFVGIQYCGLAWALAHPLVQTKLFQYYGDVRLIDEQYPVSRKWLELVSSQFPDKIVTSGLSDHESIAPVDTSALLTPLFALAASKVGDLAKIAGNGEPELPSANRKLGDNPGRYARLADDISQRLTASVSSGQTESLATTHRLRWHLHSS